MDEMLTHVAVENHGNDAGRLDYKERRHDVDVCGFGADWLRPAADACNAYLKAQGLALVCNDVGIQVERWLEWSAIWVASFCLGYEAAAEDAAKASAPTKGER